MSLIKIKRLIIHLDTISTYKSREISPDSHYDAAISEEHIEIHFLCSLLDALADSVEPEGVLTLCFG